MAEINQLPSADTLSNSDLMVIFSTENGGARKASLTTLMAFVQPLLTAGNMIVQYSAPEASGFTVNVAPVVDGGSVHLLLKPLAAYATGTVVLPLKSASAHGQEVLVTSKQAVTALTVSGNGASVHGAPVTLAANGFFRLRYDGVELSWFRVG